MPKMNDVNIRYESNRDDIISDYMNEELYIQSNLTYIKDIKPEYSRIIIKTFLENPPELSKSIRPIPPELINQAQLEIEDNPNRYKLMGHNCEPLKNELVTPAVVER